MTVWFFVILSTLLILLVLFRYLFRLEKVISFLKYQEKRVRLKKQLSKNYKKNMN
jgi:hypothetical protein